MKQSEAAAYLRRIEYQEAVHTDERTLSALVRAHLEHIPFENLDVYDFGKVPELDEAVLYEKLVVKRRGGYCFEMNTLFGHLLEALGFRVYYVTARILWNKEKLSPATHMGVVAVIDDKKYFCDIGYGGPGPKGLVALTKGQQEIDGDTFRVLVSEEHGFVLERLHHGEWKGLLCFDDFPVRALDFRVPNFYCARNTEIMFCQKRLVNLCTPNGSKALTDLELTIRENGEVRQVLYADKKELEQGLWEEFGIRIELPEK